MYSLNKCQTRTGKIMLKNISLQNNMKICRYKLKRGISCSRDIDASASLQKYYEAFAKRMKMAGIKPHHRIAIGVSGGADSMALCILASRWKCTELGENAMTGAYVNGLEGFIVDHGLRSESSNEATCVQNWVSKIGIHCDISKCEWPYGPPKQGHMEEAARNARYKILKDKCMHYKIGVLLVAHHADDQAELFVLRLSRHSGVAGLAGMAFVSQLFADTFSASGGTCDNYSVLLVRPLLCFIKDDLYKSHLIETGSAGFCQHWQRKATQKRTLQYKA